MKVSFDFFPPFFCGAVFSGFVWTLRGLEKFESGVDDMPSDKVSSPRCLLKLLPLRVDIAWERIES